MMRVDCGVNGACPLVICAVPTLLKTILQSSPGLHSGSSQKTGDEELEDRGKGKPGFRALYLARQNEFRFSARQHIML